MISSFDPLDPFVERSITIATVLKGSRAVNVVGVHTFKNVEPDSPAR